MHWLLSSLRFLPAVAVCVLLGPGAAFADPAVTACDVRLDQAVAVERTLEDALFQDADGRQFLASEVRAPAEIQKVVAATQKQMRPSETDFLAVPIAPPDRWNRIPAWIVLRQEQDLRLWQARHLAQGQALFAPLHATTACADALRRAESRARADKAGLWRDGGAGLAFRTERPGAWDGAEGRYVIARGRIVSLGKTRSTRYLNFGRYWKTDVTGTVRISDEDDFNAALARAGWDLDALAGRLVEIRGVVEVRDGPLIALRHPEQLVVLEDRRAKRDGQGNH